jgi:hypothetical protein
VLLFERAAIQLARPYREPDAEERSVASRAYQLHRSGDGMDAVGKPRQTQPAAVSAPDAVVAHRQVKDIPALLD